MRRYLWRVTQLGNLTMRREPRECHIAVDHAGHRVCAHLCAGDNLCCLNPRTPHTLHHCKNPRCSCHSQYRQRFQPLDTTKQLCYTTDSGIAKQYRYR
jgi:hypothetical protein